MDEHPCLAGVQVVAMARSLLIQLIKLMKSAYACCAVFFLPNILCVHVRNLGTSVRKSTTKSDLQNLQNRYQCRTEQTTRSFVILLFREEMYESEVMDIVASQALCMHAIAFEAWAFAAGNWRF